MRYTALASLLLTLASCACATPVPEGGYFRLQVVDGATRRGIPLVELETVNNILYVTDSAGVAAVHEPGLMGKPVYFHVRSHGYQYEKDGFGYRGFRAVLAPGGSLTVAMQRVNIAERLYRVTGAGIYRDSVLLGDKVPIAQPLLNGGVLGQDSVLNATYKGRLYWFWGDTNRAGYPLGNFAVSGAVSELPGHGGLDPSVGVDLRYFVDDEGFSRKMCPIQGPGPVWLGGLMVVRHDGHERMVCHYARMQDLGTMHEHGIAIWNDEREIFEKVRQLPLDVRLYPQGHPVQDAGWFHFPNPYPAVRVRARLEDILDPERYEAFTCLRAGSGWSGTNPLLERDARGKLVWGWKGNTGQVTPARWNELVHRKLVDPAEGWMNLFDAETGTAVEAHGGSVAWNEHRQRWVMIALQVRGRSMLGEVWYAEAETLLGPWERACRVVTHDDYSFYNVKQHPCFAQGGGRWIYFEGTYTTAFSGNTKPTPRYDYNQVMYRLDLDDPRLRPARGNRQP